jgi:DNA polymerase alpha subunit B
MGSGVRVPLRFAPNFKVRGGPKGQASVSLFPGAIVALKGRNGGGGWFSVDEVLSVRLFISSVRIDVPSMFSCLACSRPPHLPRMMG